MKRVLLIIISTISMYISNYILFFLFMPIVLLFVFCGTRKVIIYLKRIFASSLFWVIGKKITVVGLNNISKNQKCLVVSNYPSLYTTFALMRFIPEMSFIADDFIARIPLIGFLLKETGTIFVDQKRPRQAKEAIDRALGDKSPNIQYLLIYPEGKRSIDGRIDRFKYGFTYILRHSSYNLLPVTANGFYQLKPVKRVYLDPSASLEIIFHTPIANIDIQRMSKEELITKTEEKINENYRP